MVAVELVVVVADQMALQDLQQLQVVVVAVPMPTGVPAVTLLLVLLVLRKRTVAVVVARKVLQHLVAATFHTQQPELVLERSDNRFATSINR